MRRRLFFSLASLLSLLLCVATVVMCVRSYWVELQFGSTWEERQVSVCVVRGHVALVIWDRWFHPEDRQLVYWGAIPLDLSSVEDAVSRPTDAYLRRHGLLGFYYAVESIPRDDLHFAVLPAWFVLTLMAIPLAFALKSLASYRPPDAGFCQCSYNLSGNTSGVCPECGTAVAQKAEA